MGLLKIFFNAGAFQYSPQVSHQFLDETRTRAKLINHSDSAREHSTLRKHPSDEIKNSFEAYLSHESGLLSANTIISRFGERLRTDITGRPVEFIKLTHNNKTRQNILKV